MPDPILQRNIPDGVPWRHAPAARLPGLSPLPLKDWLLRDDVFSAQMALREQLITKRRADVIALQPGAAPAAEECLDTVLEALDAGYNVGPARVRRPDGVEISIDREDPLATIGRLIQSDICLMEAGPDGYVLTGAVLCFPASWTLSEKIGKPLPAIHTPVDVYDTDLARRVQRVFEAIRPETILTRANALRYDAPDLFAPRREAESPHTGEGYLRTERQTLRRLPRTGAVVFGIHTTVVAMKDVPEAERQAFLKAATRA